MAAEYKLGRLGGGFPCGLNTVDDDANLKPDQTPSGYGFTINTDGLLSKGTIPSGTARIEKTNTLNIVDGEAVNLVPYYWHYKRLWNITNRTASTASTILHYGAIDYPDVFYRQGLGRIYFDEDSETIVAFIPFQPDSAAVLKSTGGYILGNLSDTRAFFTRSDIIQELACPAANQAVELGGIVYVTNTAGLVGFRGGQIEEVSRDIRTTSLSSKAITVDYKKQRIILGTDYVYDVGTKKWFQYSGSSFLYTSPRLHTVDYSPFTVDRLVFVVNHGTSEDGGDLTYQVRYEDEDWLDEETVYFPYEQEKFTTVSEGMRTARKSRRFQIKITDLTGVGIRDILVDSKDGQFDDYSA